MTDLADTHAEVGSIKISVVMGEEGLATMFSFEGMSREAAIGHLTIVADRLRAAAASGWADDDLFQDFECPHCGEVIGDDPNDTEDEDD